MSVEPSGKLQMDQLLEQCAVRHSQLCPRQVLGVRMGLLARKVHNLEYPKPGTNLLTLLETDGCAADGVSVATGCTVGNRRLRVLDFGKVAATFMDMSNGEAIRVSPRSGIRTTAQRLVPDVDSGWQAQLEAYQIMPDSDLLKIQPVMLTIPLEELLSKPNYRVNCDTCGEEIINEREVPIDGKKLCQACAGQSYYRIVAQERTQVYSLLEEDITPTIQPKTNCRHQRISER